MHLVAGIDALRAVADVEITLNLRPETFSSTGTQIFFGGAGVDGGFVDDDVAVLEALPTVSEALISGVRSGRLCSSMGVGTVTMKTLQAEVSEIGACNEVLAASRNSSSLTSSVGRGRLAARRRALALFGGGKRR